MRWTECSKAGGILLAAVLAGQPCPAQEKPRPLAPAITMLQCGHLIDTLAESCWDRRWLQLRAITLRRCFLCREAGFARGECRGSADATCMPGLSDMHVHLSQQSDLNNSFVEEMTLNESE